MRLAEALADCRARSRALLATNFYNVETLRAVLAAARATGADLILQASPSTIDYLGLEMTAAMARTAAKQEGVRAWLHLDHATDPALARRCVDAGFDSVMIDASERPFAENVRLSAALVGYAHAAGVLVEAELGYVPKLGQADDRSGLTAPDEARTFARDSGVDLLAVAIGNVHGFYKREPALDLARLAAIHEVVAVPLVLHGGSGLSADDWRAVIARGVCKINLATEIKDAFMRALKDTLGSSDDIDLRRIFPVATAAAAALVERKLRIVTATGETHEQAAR